ncbi:MAG: alpha/beta fold hydrolase [Celeribacter marinus]
MWHWPRVVRHLPPERGQRHRRRSLHPVTTSCAPSPILFYHGLPGAPSDRTLLSTTAPTEAVDWLAALDTDAPFETAICAQFERLTQDRDPVHLIGFSLGAMAVLTLATRHPTRVSRVTLISPAGPWADGAFADQMAGASVFRAARRSRTRLTLLAVAQMTWLRFAPDLFLRTVFKSAHSTERALIAMPALRIHIVGGYARMFSTHLHAYVRALRHYACAWTPTTLPAHIPVALIQGTKDTWTPPDMARDLAARLGPQTHITWIDDAGHYGALTALTDGPMPA